MTLEELVRTYGPRRRRPLGKLGKSVVARTTEGRPVIANPDGSFSTERTITFDAPFGGYVTVPSMLDGKEVAPDTVYSIMEANQWIDPETGKRATYGDTPEESIRAYRPTGYPRAGPYDEPKYPDLLLNRLLARLGY